MTVHSRFRFSLRTLFMVLTAACLVIVFLQWLSRPEVEPIPFDAAAWKLATPIARNRTVRSQMIDDLQQKYDFIGWKRPQIIQLLGPPDVYPSPSAWDDIYILGMERAGSFSLDTECLGFRFDSMGKVTAWGCWVN